MAKTASHLRLLFVLEHFYPFVGGVSVLFEELARELVRRGHTVTVLTSGLAGSPAREDYHGIQIERIWTPPFSQRYWFTILAISRLWQLVTTADIIQTTTYNAALPSRLIGWLRRKPVVITVHEVWGRRWFTYPTHRLLSWIYWLIEGLIVRLPYDHLIADSAASAQDLINARGRADNISAIHLGIDHSLFDAQAFPHRTSRQAVGLDDHFWFLYYGRPGISKGVELLVKAFQEIHQAYPIARLLLLLNQNPADRYRAIVELVKTHGLTTVVDIRQPVPRAKLPQVIAASDAVVVPSLAEGFGFTAAEACAMGRPVVTTTAGSLPEVVSGQAILVNPGSVSALAEGLRRALAHQWQTIPIKRFAWETTAAGYEAVYREVC